MAGKKILATNKRARHEYFIEETYECGIELKGTEVKSIRQGKVNLSDGFASVDNSEVFLKQVHISPYEQGNIFNVDSLRVRKLLLHKHEIRKLIGDNFEPILGNDKVLKITIFAPQGETVAKKTFNPRLGIVGGISIIGTTGIVEPMSDEGWKKSLSIELQMKKEQGLDKIILVPGNHGEQFIREKLNLDIKYVVRVSNFIGYMIKEAQRIGYKKILMAGHIGKFIKVSAGIFNTHSKVADARSEILVANLALMGARYEFLNKINQCVTTEEAVELINNSEYREVYNILSNKCRERVKQYLNEDSDDIDVEVIIFSMDKSLLGKSDNTDDLVEVFI